MTRIIKETRTCSMCGEQSEQLFCASIYSCGSTQLDLRDPGVSRLTMTASYEKCPHCGYIASSIEEKPSDPQFAKELARKKLIGAPFSWRTSSLVKDLYRMSLIAQHDKDAEREFYFLLSAIWCCDDSFDNGTAKRLRKKLLKLFDHLDDDVEPAGETRAVMRSDIMRRAGLFKDVVAEFSNIKLEDEQLGKILAFEIQLAEKRDGKAHDMSEISE